MVKKKVNAHAASLFGTAFASGQANQEGNSATRAVEANRMRYLSLPQEDLAPELSGRRTALEISSIGHFETSAISPEAQEPVASRQEVAAVSVSQDANEVLTSDRVELVQAQNSASPVVKPVDFKEALTLIQQMREQLSLMDRQDKYQLYRFDRLRGLCFRLNQQP